MAFEQTTRTLADLRTEVTTIMSDTSDVFVTESEQNRAIRDAAGDIAHDVDAEYLPWLRVVENYVTIAGANTYNLANIVSQTFVRPVVLSANSIPVLPIRGLGKMSVFGNPTNCGNYSGLPRYYNRGQGTVELYGYGSGSTPYPSVTLTIDYIKYPTLSDTGAVPFIDAVANLIPLKAAHRLMLKNRRMDVADRLIAEYQRRVGELNGMARTEAFL